MCFQEALQQEWEANGRTSPFRPGSLGQAVIPATSGARQRGEQSHTRINKVTEYLPRRRNMDVGFIEGLVSSSWTCVLGNDSA
eukprot:m.227615 g.227615  ORF g.227615 m.227615 type:complete len:83 (-) comp54244_c0_seq25:1702-1950(-)